MSTAASTSRNGSRHGQRGPGDGGAAPRRPSPRPGNTQRSRGRALVFGIRCDDPEPAEIVSVTKERHGDFDSEDRLDGRVARSLLVRIVQMPTRLGARMRGDASECWRSQEPYPFRNGYESCAIRPRISEPDYSDIPTRLLGYP